MSIFKYFKIYDNEDCPCGSGKSYGCCCKNRADIHIQPSKKPLNIQIMEQLKKANSNAVYIQTIPDVLGI